jgi:hypothetical protein
MRRLAAAALLAVTVLLPTVSSPPVVQAAACIGWSSATTPPPTIRVLRSGGVVQLVDFKTYVKVVMPAEWPSTWPQEVFRAGAVTIKQYAWYYAMHPRGGTVSTPCYDVSDGSNDQVYVPTRTQYVNQIQAVESTWPETITKNGAFVFTSYRPGNDGTCGQDADGYHLFQHTARTCAYDGKTGEQILDIYYGPGLVIQGAPTPPDAPTGTSAVAYDTTAQVSWTAPASDGREPITTYTATSTPDGKTCTTSGALSCAVSGLGNGIAYTFTVTATNIVGASAPSVQSALVTPHFLPGSTYVPITPVRLLDTRAANGLTGKLTANTPATFQIAGRLGIPADATAVTGNLTVVNSSSSWAVYLGPDPVANPSTSTINFASGEIAANGLTVALSGSGSLSATFISNAGNTTDLVFDVTGYFTTVGDTKGDTYHPTAPARLLDTRVNNGLSGKIRANTPATFAVAGRGGVPGNAKAVTGNVTVVNSSFSWAVYLGPDPIASPTTSTINFNPGEIKANSLTVALSATGTLSATFLSTPGNTTDLVFDVTGYYTADATGSKFVPLPPSRLLDTRVANGFSGKLPANTPASFLIIGRACVPVGATAVTGNVTVVNETSSWAVFVGPLPTATPSTSTINFKAGDIRANGLTVALGVGGILSATYISTAGNTTDLVFDMTGYFVPAG